MYMVYMDSVADRTHLNTQMFDSVKQLRERKEISDIEFQQYSYYLDSLAFEDADFAARRHKIIENRLRKMTEKKKK